MDDKDEIMQAAIDGLSDLAEGISSEAVPVSVAPAVEEVPFHYVKSPWFRSIHVDGIFGGPAPNRQNIHVAVFSERLAIPQTVYHPVLESGAVDLQHEIRRTGKQGVVREMEADLVLNLNAAKALQEWLGRHIQQLEEIQQRERDETKSE